MENAYDAPPYGWKFPLTSTNTEAKLPRPVARVKPLRRPDPYYSPTPNAPIAPINLKKAASVVGPESTHMICCDCSSEIDTVTDVKPGQAAYRSGAMLFMLGFVCGCCLIPCCMDTCMDVHHKCPECGTHLGRYQRH